MSWARRVVIHQASKDFPLSGIVENLAEELQQIKTPQFHVVDGPASAEMRAAIVDSGIPVPPSYVDLVLQFGNAKLYRLLHLYQVQVFAAPREAFSKDGERLLHFGGTDHGLAYFKDYRLIAGGESPVFQWSGESGQLRQAAPGFEAWLRKRCHEARRRYGKDRWEQILRGPPPFEEWELAIIETRRQFSWRVVGVSSARDLLIEIHNGSTMRLPCLSLGQQTHQATRRSLPAKCEDWERKHSRCFAIGAGNRSVGLRQRSCPESTGLRDRSGGLAGQKPHSFSGRSCCR